VVLPVNEASSNLDVQRALARRVAEEILGVPANDMSMASGALATNYFSFTFPVEVGAAENRRRVFVKVPKADLYNNSATILPISGADRRMAEEEANSLRLLADQWQAEDLDVSWVHLRGEVPDYNAVVTDSAQGEHALDVFRRMDLRRRFGCITDRDRLRAAMARLGVALGRFHLRHTTEAEFLPGLAAPKLLKYVDEISQLTKSVWPSRVARLIEQMGISPIPGLLTTTLKGLDIRNILIDRSYRITLLDPGRMKKAYREEDIARFLMTWRILYWGTGWFALALEPDAAAETAFLDGYQESMGRPLSNCLHRFFLLKEILKHWRIAYIALSLKHWPHVINRLVAVHYIDRFFERQLAKLG